MKQQIGKEASTRDLLETLREACKGLGIAPNDVQAALAPEDVAAFEAREISVEALHAFALALMEYGDRQHGRVPERYTHQAACNHCGLVWLPPTWPVPVNNCPWCSNRLEELPIPRPEPVACGDCKRYRPDAIGTDGIGTCTLGNTHLKMPPTDRYPAGYFIGLPLYPWVKRRCNWWLPARAG